MSMEIIQRPSPNFDARDDAEISIIILHYTGMENADVALARLTDVEAKVSSHYTIGEDGKIYQHVEEDQRAWHAGVSSWRGRRDINARSIGIELVNKGHEFGYHDFPGEQIAALIELCHDIQSRHEIEHVLAHSDVAPNRKQDPGELFPWPRLAQENIGIWPQISVEDKIKGGTINVSRALRDLGYDTKNKNDALIAFQRRYAPEVFQNNTQGKACALTKGRLYALLAGHVLTSD